MRSECSACKFGHRWAKTERLLKEGRPQKRPEKDVVSKIGLSCGVCAVGYGYEALLVGAVAAVLAAAVRSAAASIGQLWR